jgi:hypothetical protein
MGNYTVNIIQIDNGYVIKNYTTGKIIICYIVLILYGGLFLFPIIDAIMNIIINKDFSFVFWAIFYFTVFYLPLLLAANDIKRIIININEQKIIFKYGLIPFIKKRNIDIKSLKEISINHTTEHSNMIGRSIKKVDKTYNIDLIDNNLYSYRIYRSEVYNDDLLNLSKKTSEILNVKINDQNNIEGYKNIFVKNII